jgi:tetratricopeptide (TPR) repeat protein
VRAKTLPVTLLLALACAPAWAQDRTDPIKFLKKGIQLYQKTQYDEAVAYLARYRGLVPQDWRGHVWQAFTLLRQAALEKNPVRRNAFLEEASSMQKPLINQAGMLWQSPLRHYLNGLDANVRGDKAGAYLHLAKARAASHDLFRKYESVRLMHHVKQAYALAALDKAVAQIMQGSYEDADRTMDDVVRDLPKDDQRQKFVVANLAVIKEGMGQYGIAIKYMRQCIDIARKEKNTDKEQEYIATIALVHLHTKDIEKAGKVLEELPKDCKHPEVVATRCRIRMIETEREPDRLLDTLKYFKKAMVGFPEEQMQRLVVDYGNLIVTYMARADVAKHKDLLLDAVEMVNKERLRHPECPPPYWILAKLYTLLGEEKKAAEFLDLHERKKKEYKGKHRYDERGRTRCASTS